MAKQSLPELTLGFDTSAAHCAAALLDGDRLIGSRLEPMPRGQAERLMPMLQEMLAETGKTWADLSLLAVCTGPGNFTGIRIAIAAARGLALSLNIPAIGISAPEAAAHGLPRPCRVILPARGDQVIWQDFDTRGAVAGPASGSVDALPPGPPVTAPLMPIAESVARLARARRDSPQPRPAPIYLRPADAAPARDRGPVMLP